MRQLLFAGTLLCLAIQGPQGGKVGWQMDNVELWKYVATQGGLTIVCIVMFFWQRRDYMKRAREDSEARETLIELVKQNTAALTSQSDTTNRMARALEMLEFRR